MGVKWGGFHSFSPLWHFQVSTPSHSQPGTWDLFSQGEARVAPQPTFPALLTPPQSQLKESQPVPGGSN